MWLNVVPGQELSAGTTLAAGVPLLLLAAANEHLVLFLPFSKSQKSSSDFSRLVKTDTEVDLSSSENLGK